MAKAPIFDATKRFLNPATIRPLDPAEHGSPAVVPGDLMVAGRRYRLIPVDSDEAAAEPVSAAELLTPRELQIVLLVAEGNVNKQIADVLRISEWTVSTHLRRIFAKLGVDTRAAMVSRCVGAVSASRKQIS
jgi:DNA-binding CsgD family transcriptional regulator